MTHYDIYTLQNILTYINFDTGTTMRRINRTMNSMIKPKIYDYENMKYTIDITQYNQYELCNLCGFNNSKKLGNQLKTITPEFLLSSACYGGGYEMIQIAIDLGDCYWEWGLEMACRGGHSDIVEMMIRRGAQNWNVALIDSCYGGYMELVTKFVKLGATAFDNALAAACQGGNLLIAQYMIKLGATSFGWGIVEACRYNHLDLVMLLLPYCPESDIEYLICEVNTHGKPEKEREYVINEITTYLSSYMKK